MIKCYKCPQIAVWMYMPSNETRKEHERYFCDNCISRGCSCNWLSDNECSPIIDDDGETFKEAKDEQGRLLPCCEYDYCEKGYDYEDNKDKF